MLLKMVQEKLKRNNNRENCKTIDYPTKLDNDNQLQACHSREVGNLVFKLLVLQFAHNNNKTFN